MAGRAPARLRGNIARRILFTIREIRLAREKQNGGVAPWPRNHLINTGELRPYERWKLIRSLNGNSERPKQRPDTTVTPPFYTLPASPCTRVGTTRTLAATFLHSFLQDPSIEEGSPRSERDASSHRHDLLSSARRADRASFPFVARTSPLT